MHKKSRNIAKYLCIFTLILLLTCYGVVYLFNIPIFRGSSYVIKNQVDINKKMTLNEVIQDRKQLINIIESVHPIFLNNPSKDYLDLKNTFIEKTSKAMTLIDFEILSSKYLSSLKDGHTQLFYQEKWILDAHFKYVDNELILLDKSLNSTGKKVLKLNDYSINELINTIPTIFPGENYIADNNNISYYVKYKSILQYCGIVYTNSNSVTATLFNKDTNEEEHINIKFKEIKNDNKPINSEDIEYAISSKKLNDNTLYIELESCKVNDKFKDVIKDIKRNIKNGTKNYIVDLRNNAGGEVKVSDMLFDALNIEPGHFGYLERYSSLLQKAYGFPKKSGYSIKAPRNNAKGNSNINLYIVVNEYSFSTSMIISTLTKDGSFGTVVGVPLSNKPTSYGDMLLYQLSNSKLEGQVSFTKWLRPDSSKDDEAVLNPDILVKKGQDPIKLILNLPQRSK